MDSSNRVYVTETFKGIEKVFPGKQIIKTDYPVASPEFGFMICPGCGQRNVFEMEIPNGIMNVFFDIKGNIYIKTSLPFDPERVPLYAQYDDDGEPKSFGLFEEYENYCNNYAGGGIYCPNCGSAMSFGVGYHNTGECPGCNFCGRESTREESLMFCINNYIAGKCETPEDCIKCNGNYARVKNGISFEEIVKHVRDIRGY